MKYLILFDGPCFLCHRAILAVVKRDHEGIFFFAPLQGETAQKFHLPPGDSVVLVEDFEGRPKIFVEGRAVNRIAKILGYTIFCPNWLYRLIAKNRNKICKRGPNISQIRLLP